MLIVAITVVITTHTVQAHEFPFQGDFTEEFTEDIRQLQQDQVIHKIKSFSEPNKQRQSERDRLNEQISQITQEYKELYHYPTQQMNQSIINKIKQETPNIVNNLTDEEIDLASRIGVTYFGDSLVAGSKSQFQQLFLNSNVYGVGGMQIAPDGMSYLRQLLDNNVVAPIVVVVLGTNRGLEEQELDDMVGLLKDRQIFFVDTISHVGHRSQVANEIQQVAKRYPHVHAINFSSQEQASYFDSDMIHHSNTGKQAMVQYIAKNIYKTYFSEPQL